jgi:hypothetical protein
MVRPSWRHSPSSHAVPKREAGQILGGSNRLRRSPLGALAVGLGAGVVLFADLLVVAGGRGPVDYEGYGVAVAAVVPPVDPTPVVVPVALVVEPVPVDAPPVPHHRQRGVASWFDAPKGTCAHRTIPKGTIVTVVRADAGTTTTCRVADRGPSDQSRVIDLSRDTFAKLAGAEKGLLQVQLRW